VSRAVCRKVMRSPLTGLEMVCPVKAILGSLLWLDPTARSLPGGSSYVVGLGGDSPPPARTIYASPSG
jgi:hypothetical protein